MPNTTNIIDVEIGARVRSFRVAKGLSQTDLATACGITFQQIQKYEKGTNRVAGSRIVQIANALGVPASYLVSGSDDTPGHYSDAMINTRNEHKLLSAFRQMDPATQTAALNMINAILAAQEQLKPHTRAA